MNYPIGESLLVSLERSGKQYLVKIVTPTNSQCGEARLFNNKFWFKDASLKWLKGAYKTALTSEELSLETIDKDWVRFINMIQTSLASDDLQPPEDEKGEDEAKTTPGMVKEDEEGITFYEEILQDGNPIFLKYNDGVAELVEGIENGTDEPITPRWDDIAAKGLVKLVNAEQLPPTFLQGNIPADINTEELIEKIREHIHKYVDVSADFQEFSIWYILLSWVYDRLSTLPYLRSLGDYGTGKSRFLDVVGGLCYRSVHAGGATSAAAVARVVELWKGTLIYNEADFHKSDEAQDIIKILNEGFEKRRGLIKAHKENQKELVVYDTFGPKILATRKQWKDPALESRCITEIMKETHRDDISPLLSSTFEREQEELRALLLLWRFKNWESIDEEKVDLLLPKFTHLERRLVQSSAVFSLLFSHDDKMLNRFSGFINDYQRSQKEDRASTFDGMIINTIYGLISNDNTNITCSEIAERMIEAGWDSTKAGVVGKHLRVLGLKTRAVKTLERKVIKALVLDEDLLPTLFKRYVLDLDPNSRSNDSYAGNGGNVTLKKLSSQHTLDKDREESVVESDVTAVTAVSTDNQSPDDDSTPDGWLGPEVGDEDYDWNSAEIVKWKRQQAEKKAREK